MCSMDSITVHEQEAKQGPMNVWGSIEVHTEHVARGRCSWYVFLS